MMKPNTILAVTIGRNQMKIVDSYTVEIYIGLREMYTDIRRPYGELLNFCNKFCDQGLCLSIAPIDYVYTNGHEKGARITLINYPRFPKEDQDIVAIATELGYLLMREFKQFRVSIVTPGGTYMVENIELLDQQGK